MKASLITLLAAALLGAGIVQAQNEYAEIARLRGMNQTVRGIRSMADGEHYTTLEGSNIIRHSYAAAGSGERMLPSSAANLTITDYSFSPDERQILIASGSKPIYRHSYTTSYFLAAGNSLTPVLREVEAPRDASFSPDSRLIAYSDRNDLYVYDTAARQTRRITDDGAWNSVINGTTDWVYEEEFGFTKAYAFSPDSRRIAYLRFDESQVPLMEMMRFDGKLYNQAYSFKYPKAGERNSTVEVWVCDLATGAKERIDTGRETDQYIPRIGWTPDGRLYFFRLNRRQNTFEVILCEPNGAQRTIYDERSQQYVERVDDSSLTFVDKDRFLVRQESHTGYMHLYLYSIRRGFLAQVTKGDWEVTDVAGTDGKRVWYLSTETSPLRRNLYSVRLDGTQKRRLTTSEGFYTIAPSAGMKYYISTFSNAATPNRVEICDGEGNPVRLLADSKALRDELAAANRPQKEFFTFATERGDTLNAYMRAYCDFMTESEELKIANSVWTDSSAEAKRAFLQKAVDSYSAQLFSAPLSDPKTVESINSWVKKNTDGMIPKIIEKADRYAVMMLVNAIAFDAKWETPYKRSDIEKLEFTSYSGSKKKTDFMCSTENVYLKDGGTVGFMKPYKNGRFAFAALLPDENTGIDDYVASLSGDKLMKIFSSAKRGNEVNVKMPKFRAEYSTQLIDTLKKMGVKDAFDSKTADFSSLIENRDAYIATVVHKTFIEVDENGTRAAASTLVGADTMSLMEPYSVFLNRPFVYMIVDTETNLPLFIGVQTEI